MSEKKTLLFVDDEPDILLALKALFRQRYEVYTADNGAAAIDLLRRQRIDVLICDQRMPGMTGIAVLREALEFSPKTVRLLLTGYADQQAVLDSVNIGEVFRFLQKPWQSEELRQTIADAVRYGEILSGQAPSQVEAATLLLAHDQAAIREALTAHLNWPNLKIAKDGNALVEILNQEEVALLVCDVTFDGENMAELIKALKIKRPALLSLIISEAVDSDAVIDLINYGQLYRYWRWPNALNLIEKSLENGLRFYAHNKNSLSQKPLPASRANPAQHSRLAAKIL